MFFFFLQWEDWTERLKVRMSKRSKINSKMALAVVQRWNLNNYKVFSLLSPYLSLYLYLFSKKSHPHLLWARGLPFILLSPLFPAMYILWLDVRGS